ncbi:MAG TPA: carbonic anhydrase [Bryobacteraceae bacterium]|nr:carbonic anhydrase [Bryobacteraceae bacterium]
MEKVFHFDSPQEVYTADACVISCFDARFDIALRKFLKRSGIQTFDHIKIPGSAKTLAAPASASDRDLVIAMIRTSRRLHRPGRLLLIAHRECGAYEGVPLEVVVSDVVCAAGVILAAEPTLPVECYFNDFDGIYRIR